MANQFQKETKKVKASDDWFPCYPGNEIEASLIKDNNNAYRVAFFGEDDFGMEKIFEDLDEAKAFFHNLNHPISKEWLKSKGFVHA